MSLLRSCKSFTNISFLLTLRSYGSYIAQTTNFCLPPKHLHRWETFGKLILLQVATSRSQVMLAWWFGLLKPLERSYLLQVTGDKLQDSVALCDERLELLKPLELSYFLQVTGYKLQVSVALFDELLERSYLLQVASSRSQVMLALWFELLELLEPLKQPAT